MGKEKKEHISWEMTQSRLLSPIIELMEKKKIEIQDLAKMSDIKESDLKMILHLDKKLSLDDLVKMQQALDHVIQVPKMLSVSNHHKKFYK